MELYSCLVCGNEQDTQRYFCLACGGLTSYSQKSLAPYKPLRLLVRWEAGSLYRGVIALDEHDNPGPDAKPLVPSEVWIFTYDEEIVHTPALIRLQQEDRKLALLPHPNLPKQLDRGHIGHRPYMIFEGEAQALPLPIWRPNLPKHVISTIFSRLAELVLLLQSAGIQRPVIDPFRLMVFWDEADDLLDFRWLPLPELGQYLYREGFTPHAMDEAGHTSPEEAVPSAALVQLDEPRWTTQALHDPGHEPEPGSGVVARGPLLPEQEAESQRETTVVQRAGEISSSGGGFHEMLSAHSDVTADVPTVKSISKKLAETDDFEIMTVLEELGESSEDLEALARRLAALEQGGHFSGPPAEQDASGKRASGERASGERASGEHSPNVSGHSLIPSALDAAAIADATDAFDASFAPDRALFPHKLGPPERGLSLFERLHPQDDEITQPGVGASQEFEASTDPVTMGVSVMASKSFVGTSLLHMSPDESWQEQKVSVAGQLVVQHPHLMRVHQIHSFAISLQPDGDNAGNPAARSPKVMLTPIFPGCLISPAQVTLEQWGQKAQFWITPFVPGDLRESAVIETRVDGVSSATIAVPCVSQRAFFPRLLTILAVATLIVALVPPPARHSGVSGTLWLFFHHWGFAIAGGFGIIAMLTRWWPRPVQPVETRTTLPL